MLEQQKFRASLDFYELRAMVGDVDADVELAEWWREFSDGDVNNRQNMLDALRGTPAGTDGAAKKKRRRRKPKAGPSTIGAGQGQQGE
jgi:poly(A) polymerase